MTDYLQYPAPPAPPAPLTPPRKSRTGWWVALVLAALLVAGGIGAALSSSAHRTPAVVGAPVAPVAATPVVEVSTPDPAPVDPDTQFLVSAHQLYPDLNVGGTDASAISLAHSVCAAFGRGATRYDIAQAYADAGTTLPSGAMAAVIVAGVNTYCPEYVDQLGG